MAEQQKTPERPAGAAIETDFFGADDYAARADSYDDVWADKKKSSWDSRVHAALVVSVLGVLGAAFTWLGVPTGADATTTVHRRRLMPLPAKKAPTTSEIRQITHTRPLDQRTLAALGGRPLPAEEKIEAVDMSPRLLAVLAGQGVAPKRAPQGGAWNGQQAPRKQATRTNGAPRTRKASFQTAVALYDAGKGREAIPVLQSMVRSGQANEDSLLLLGSIYHELGRKAETQRAYRAYLQRFPNGAHAAEIRGILARR